MVLALRGHGAFGGTVAGTSGTLGTASFMAEIIDTLGDFTEERPKIEYTNSSSPSDSSGRAYAQFRPSDIVTAGDYELTLLHNTQKQVPWGIEEVITITFPKRGTDATAATIVFNGFLTKHTTSMPFKDKMITKCTLCVTGIVTRTASA